ncbi:hypothetical protein PIB30_086179 [Stylosanthes scabra]|uniref:Uncharacterized protein n=1 Tax=Stylosanthes scabra TaxID=79078 RepID=A0ABU6YRU5_9FABA|nr:hypothetical protein [Stylosanthes scabra]
MSPAGMGPRYPSRVLGGDGGQIWGAGRGVGGMSPPPWVPVAIPTCKLTACLQVGIENAFATEVGLEKELAATRDQLDVLTAERDSALAAPLLTAKIDLLTEGLRLVEGGRLSALARMKEVEEGAKEKKKDESFTQSLEQKQTALDEAEAAAGHWREEWKVLAEETGEMVQESFDILMDQGPHLNAAIDYSMITLDTRWDPKTKRSYNPKAQTQEQSEPAAEDQPEPMAEEYPEVLAEQQVEETVAREGGGCPT